jgi:hypothetical protein
MNCPIARSAIARNAKSVFPLALGSNLINDDLLSARRSSFVRSKLAGGAIHTRGKYGQKKFLSNAGETGTFREGESGREAERNHCCGN